MDEFITQTEWNNISEENRQLIAEKIAEKRKSEEPVLNRIIKVKSSFYTRYGKRILDFIIAFVAFAIMLPIHSVIALVTFLDVGRPVFFHQKRIGKNGKLFTLTKFRNMTNATNENGVLLPPEERVTKVGKILRKTSLDEFLNLWCVLNGDMSIIGPRPLPEKYAVRFNDYYFQRHLVKPGLECPFVDKSFTQKGWQGRFENDLWYVDNLSFKTDIKMFFLLVKKVFSKKERVSSASGQTLEFVGCKPDGTIITEKNVPREYLEQIKG